MNVRLNPIKQKLASGETIFSSSVRLPAPGLCEVLGCAGFDFVLLDGEHGAMDHGTIDQMVQSCYAGGTVPVIRLLWNDDSESVMHALDLGVQGILIPHCRTADDARRLREAALYAPDGTRGFGPGRGSRWGRVTGPDYFAQANASVVLLALIEDPEGVENVEEIARSGLDVLWVGTGDLAMAYGVPGEREHPRVQAAAERILAACQKQGIAAGWPAQNAADARAAQAKGYRVLGYAGAEAYIMQQSRGFLSEFGR